MWVRDQGSEIQDPEKNLIQGPLSTGTQIRIRNTVGYAVFIYKQIRARKPVCIRVCIRVCLSTYLRTLCACVVNAA
jgi:hypothetical protein